MSQKPPPESHRRTTSSPLLPHSRTSRQVVGNSRGTCSRPSLGYQKKPPAPLPPAFSTNFLCGSADVLLSTPPVTHKVHNLSGILQPPTSHRPPNQSQAGSILTLSFCSSSEGHANNNTRMVTGMDIHFALEKTDPKERIQAFIDGYNHPEYQVRRNLF